MERRDWSNRPPEEMFDGSTGLPPEKEKEIWRNARRIVLANANGCGIRLGRLRGGVAVYGTHDVREDI